MLQATENILNKIRAVPLGAALICILGGGTHLMPKAICGNEIQNKSCWEVLPIQGQNRLCAENTGWAVDTAGKERLVWGVGKKLWLNAKAVIFPVLNTG